MDFEIKVYYLIIIRKWTKWSTAIFKFKKNFCNASKCVSACVLDHPSICCQGLLSAPQSVIHYDFKCYYGDSPKAAWLHVNKRDFLFNCGVNAVPNNMQRKKARVLLMSHLCQVKESES